MLAGGIIIILLVWLWRICRAAQDRRIREIMRHQRALREEAVAYGDIPRIPEEASRAPRIVGGRDGASSARLCQVALHDGTAR